MGKWVAPKNSKLKSKSTENHRGSGWLHLLPSRSRCVSVEAIEVGLDRPTCNKYSDKIGLKAFVKAFMTLISLFCLGKVISLGKEKYEAASCFCGVVRSGVWFRAKPSRRNSA
jgi:hypothetical protein